MLRVLLKSCSEVAARSSATEGCLPQLATSYQAIRRYAKEEEKGEYGDGNMQSIPDFTCCTVVRLTCMYSSVRKAHHLVTNLDQDNPFSY